MIRDAIEREPGTWVCPVHSTPVVREGRAVIRARDIEVVALDRDARTITVDWSRNRRRGRRALHIGYDEAFTVTRLVTRCDRGGCRVRVDADVSIVLPPT